MLRARRTSTRSRRAARGSISRTHAVLTRPRTRPSSRASIRSSTAFAITAVPNQARHNHARDAAQGERFATGAFVGGVPLAREFGLDAGFDVYDDHFTSNGQPSDFSLAERPAGEVVDAALKWIAGQQGRWFVWVHVFDPHAPYAPPAPFDKEYAGRPYYGEVAYVDKALGPLLDAASRGPRPTTIVMTGDHGEGLGDHGELTHGLFAYEATLRVPLMLARAGARRSTCRLAHTGAARRHRPDAARRGRRPDPQGLPGRSLLPGAPAIEIATSRRIEAMSAMLNARLGAAAGRRRRTREVRGPAEARVADLAADPREEATWPIAAGLAARARDPPAGLPTRLLGERATETSEVMARSCRRSVHERQRAPQVALHRRGRSEESRPARSVDSAGHRRVAAQPAR